MWWVIIGTIMGRNTWGDGEIMLDFYWPRILRRQGRYLLDHTMLHHYLNVEFRRLGDAAYQLEFVTKLKADIRSICELYGYVDPHVVPNLQALFNANETLVARKIEESERGRNAAT